MNDQRLRRRGDSRARSELAARYLPLARSLALRYRHTQEPIEDHLPRRELITEDQVGNAIVRGVLGSILKR